MPSNTGLPAFLSALTTDAPLRAAFAAFAAEHGFDLRPELSEKELDRMAGGLSPILPSVDPTISTLGPLRPGNTIGLTGLGDRYDGSYYVDGTQHSIDSDD